MKNEKSILSIADLINRGTEKWRQGRLSRAEEDFNQAFTIEPGNRVVSVGLRQVKWFQKKSAELVERGIEKWHQGRFDRAEEYFNQALKIDSENIAALINRGIVKQRQGKLSEAEEYFNQALKIDSENVAALVSLGEVKHSQDKFGEAEEYFNQALKIDSENVAALVSLGEVKHSQDKFGEAEEDLNKALKLEPDNVTALINRGRAKQRQGKLSEAEEDLNKALKIDSENIAALINRGIVKQRQNKFSEAEEYFNQALKLEPKNVTALVNRGVVKQRQGRLSRAEEDFNQAFTIEPGNRVVSVGLRQVKWLRKKSAKLVERGREKQRQGRLGEAEEYFNQALTIEPKNVTALVNRGIVKWRQGRLSEAEEYFNQALKLEPKNVTALVNRGIVKQRQGKLSGAEEDFNQALTIEPGNRVASVGLEEVKLLQKKSAELVERGIEKQRQGRLGEAKEYFNQALKINSENDVALVNLEAVKRLQDGLDEELHRACRIGDESAVRSLLAEKASVHAANQFGWTPLHVAVQKGNDAVVFLLIENEANLKATTDKGKAPWNIAFDNNHLELAVMLLVLDFDPETADSYKGKSAFRTAETIHNIFDDSDKDNVDKQGRFILLCCAYIHPFALPIVQIIKALSDSGFLTRMQGSDPSAYLQRLISYGAITKTASGYAISPLLQWAIRYRFRLTRDIFIILATLLTQIQYHKQFSAVLSLPLSPASLQHCQRLRNNTMLIKNPSDKERISYAALFLVEGISLMWGTDQQAAIRCFTTASGIVEQVYGRKNNWLFPTISFLQAVANSRSGNKDIAKTLLEESLNYFILPNMDSSTQSITLSEMPALISFGNHWQSGIFLAYFSELCLSLGRHDVALICIKKARSSIESTVGNSDRHSFLQKLDGLQTSIEYALESHNPEAKVLWEFQINAPEKPNSEEGWSGNECEEDAWAGCEFEDEDNDLSDDSNDKPLDDAPADRKQQSEQQSDDTQQTSPSPAPASSNQSGMLLTNQSAEKPQDGAPVSATNFPVRQLRLGFFQAHSDIQGHYRGQVYHLASSPVPTDGNCAYSVLGTTRAELRAMLNQAVDNCNEIALNFLRLAIKNILLQPDSSFLKNVRQELLNGTAMEHLLKNPDILKQYIEEVTSNNTWLDAHTILAWAVMANYSVIIWYPSGQSGVCATRADLQYEGPNPKNKIHVLFNNQGHFNFGYETQSPQSEAAPDATTELNDGFNKS